MSAMSILTNTSRKPTAQGSGIYGALQRCLFWGVPLALAGCAGLLPNTQQESKAPWHSYADAQEMFDNVVPGKTTLAELKALAIDPGLTPNIAVLGHADMLRRLIPIAPTDIRLLDPGLQQCISAAEPCFAYEIDQTHSDRQRVGNFWLDFLNFKRMVNVSGWQFNAIFVIKNDTVIYKLWSGKPNIHQVEEEHNPLGPFQGRGISLFQH
jgi:hypothetical protein